MRNWLTLLRRHRLLLLGARGVKNPRLLAASIDCRRGYGTHGTGRIEVGPDCWIERGAVLHAYGGHIALGKNVFLGPYCVIYGHGGVEIGDEALISMHCRILSSNHTIPPIGTDVRSQPDVLLPTRIGRDVWLGAGVTVFGGVTIGDGCIVGAGSVVTRDLPPGVVAFGAPAESKRSRHGSAASS